MQRMAAPLGALTMLVAFGATPALAASASAVQLHSIFGIPVDFILFGLTLDERVGH